MTYDKTIILSGYENLTTFLEEVHCPVENRAANVYLPVSIQKRLHVNKQKLKPVTLKVCVAKHTEGKQLGCTVGLGIGDGSGKRKNEEKGRSAEDD